MKTFAKANGNQKNCPSFLRGTSEAEGDVLTNPASVIPTKRSDEGSLFASADKSNAQPAHSHKQLSAA
jgi:hypothetical protein